MIGASLLAALAIAPSGAATADPLAPALTGEMQCYTPNDEKKTCRSLASYRTLADGSYGNNAVVLLSSAPVVTLETTTPVRVQSGAVCGTIRSQDLAQGRLVVDGRALAGDEASAALTRVAQAMAPLMGKEICTTYVSVPGGLVAKVTIAGSYRADADQRVRWVKPSDGYQVAP